MKVFIAKTERDFLNSNEENVKSLINQSRVIRRLGTGKFGKVYHAKFVGNETIPPTEYALKRLNRKSEHYNHDHVENEIEISTRNDNEFVLQCAAYLINSNFVYLVLPLCNETLEDFREKQNDMILTDIQCKHVCINVLTGLKYLDEMSVVHNDLKPENILRFGEKFIISDFGLSRKGRRRSRDDASVVTGRSGTLTYQAPETITFSEQSTKSDIYSLGVMVHELQTDMVPYIDGSDVEDEEYADAIRFGDKSISDKISQPARNFLITILHHNRYERPNAEECLRLPFLQN